MKKPASLTDSGLYTLKLNSTKQKAPNNLNIQVLPKDLFTLALPEKIELFEGERLNLEVKLNKPVNQVNWSKDTESLKLSPTSFINEKLAYSVLISQVKLEDAGKYRFECDELDDNNEKYFSECLVIVKPKPEKLVKSLKDLGTVRVKEGETVNLLVKFDKPVHRIKSNGFLMAKNSILKIIQQTTILLS